MGWRNQKTKIWTWQGKNRGGVLVGTRIRSRSSGNWKLLGKENRFEAMSQSGVEQS